MHIALEAAEAAGHSIPAFAWVAAAISAGVFTIAFVVFRSYRDVNHRGRVPGDQQQTS